jgi:hypothetical protein
MFTSGCRDMRRKFQREPRKGKARIVARKFMKEAPWHRPGSGMTGANQESGFSPSLCAFFDDLFSSACWVRVSPLRLKQCRSPGHLSCGSLKFIRLGVL